MSDANKQFLPGLFGGDIWIWIIILFFIFGGFNDSPFFGLNNQKND